ncbi:MAG: hypothetical protein AB9880_09365 [Christensenellales bacterium]
MARKRTAFYRLRYVQVPGLALLTLLMMVVAVFSLINSRLDAGISRLRGMVEEAGYVTDLKQKELQELQLRLEMAGTDDFIANEARTQYGYLSPGEIRFVVTNPEALWGAEGVPTPTPGAP